VYFFQSARSRARLLCTSVAARLADHSALSDEDDMAVAELLLQFAGESVTRRRKV
jgi:hypothetical protein